NGVANFVIKPLGELGQETAVAIRAASDAITNATKDHDELLSISRQIIAGFLYQQFDSIYIVDEEDSSKIRIQLLEAAAKLGHIEAAYHRGEVERWPFWDASADAKAKKHAVLSHDVKEKWYGVAAKAGHVQAQVLLAQLLKNKLRFLVDEAKNSQKSILDGNIANGRRNNVNFRIEEECDQWFLRAAKQNCREAQLALCDKAGFDFELDRHKSQTDSFMWGLIAGQARQLSQYDYKIVPDQLSPLASSPLSQLNSLTRGDYVLVDAEKAKEATKRFNHKLEIVISLPNAPVLNAGSGTRLFIAPRFIVTNAHVVDGWDVATIEDSTGQHMTAKVESLDEKNDLAILSVETNASQSFLTLRNEGAELAEEVFTIGFPNPEIQGTNAKYTDGKISSDSGINDDRRFYQTTVPVQPGNSGGPLVNSDGQVIGVMTSRLSDMGMLRASGSLPQNVSYAIKADYLNPLLRGLAGESFSNQRLVSDKQERSALVKRLRSAVVRVLVGQE
ncbi:MAG: trypsin-like peptidase domain-containing protein, partial [Roseimicrobium sp.]